MSDIIKDNLEEIENASSLIIQVIILVLMSMFASIHVIISFVWSGLLAVLFKVEWMPTARHYLQSWTFARLSIGIPFIVMLIIYIRIYYFLKSISQPSCINTQTMQAMVKDNGIVAELCSDFPLYSDLMKMAKKAEIIPPRLFAFFISNIINAVTTTGQNGESGIIIYEPLLETMTRNDLQAIIGHELGHIMGDDVKRGLILNALVATLASFWIQGQELVMEKSGEVLRKHGETPLFVAIVTSLLMIIVGIIMLCLGFLPWFWSKSLVWWRQYHDEYHADARGAWLIGNSQQMADALIVLHCVCKSGGRRTGHGIFQGIRATSDEDNAKDVHPPNEYRVRKLMPKFNGDWEAAYRDVMRRRGISVKTR